MHSQRQIAFWAANGRSLSRCFCVSDSFNVLHNLVLKSDPPIRCQAGNRDAGIGQRLQLVLLLFPPPLLMHIYIVYRNTFINFFLCRKLYICTLELLVKEINMLLWQVHLGS
uniref:Uncharacterized protein n=1 Tax=Arundo donax TaxID=35708 RepID=A0A0A9CKC6_ARUDO